MACLVRTPRFCNTNSSSLSVSFEKSKFSASPKICNIRCCAESKIAVISVNSVWITASFLSFWGAGRTGIGLAISSLASTDSWFWSGATDVSVAGINGSSRSSNVSFNAKSSSLLAVNAPRSKVSWSFSAASNTASGSTFRNSSSGISSEIVAGSPTFWWTKWSSPCSTRALKTKSPIRKLSPCMIG